MVLLYIQDNSLSTNNLIIKWINSKSITNQIWTLRWISSMTLTRLDHLSRDLHRINLSKDLLRINLSKDLLRINLYRGLHRINLFRDLHSSQFLIRISLACKSINQMDNSLVNSSLNTVDTHNSSINKANSSISSSMVFSKMVRDSNFHKIICRISNQILVSNHIWIIFQTTNNSDLLFLTIHTIHSGSKTHILTNILKLVDNLNPRLETMEILMQHNQESWVPKIYNELQWMEVSQWVLTQEWPYNNRAHMFNSLKLR